MNILTKDDIIDLMTKSRDLFVSRIRIGDFEVHFDTNRDVKEPQIAIHTTGYMQNLGPGNVSHAVSTFPPTVKDEKFEDLIKPVSPFDELTEDEIMYWGTAYGDELIAKRKAREEELKQEKMNHKNGKETA